MERAYTHIHVSKSINVSSTGHYTGKMYYKHHDRMIMRYVDLSNGRVLSKPEAGLYEIKMPAYVMQEMRTRFIDVMTGADVIYFEYDRDGEKRYSNLRYHAPETVAWIVECLKRDK